VSTTATLRHRWKALERAIAARLGGERVPVTGRVRGWAPDVKHRWLAIEVKSRKSQLVVIREMLDQAVKAAEWYRRRGEGERLPIGVYHVTGTRLDNAVVFMRLKDFEEYFGNAVAGPAEEQPA
jgi:hypothetical protein